jgi:PQQ-dependent catabolism-associated beta-propeller protein
MNLSPQTALSGLCFTCCILFVTAAEAAGTGFAFVSNERSNTITVLDPARDYAVAKQIATCARPRDMHFDDAHQYLYVACGDDDVIEAIDVETLEPVRRIKTGRSPEIFAFAPDGKSLFVSEEESALVRNIALDSGKTLSQISTGPEPEGVLVTPKTIYVTSEVADMVHVYDAGSEAIIRNVLVGSRPRRFALDAQRGELWVSDELSGQVTIIDTVTNEIKASVPLLPPGMRPVDVTPVGLALSRDGRTVYVALGRANHVAFIDTQTRQVRDYVLVGSRAWGLAETSDGTHLLVANGLSDDVSVVDIAAKRNLVSVPTGRSPHTVIIDD